MGSERLTTQNRTLSLPEDVCAEAEKWMAGRYENLEELLIFLLNEIVKNDAKKFDQVEEEIVEQRLRDLGYI
jgi:hypothetical protein